MRRGLAVIAVIVFGSLAHDAVAQSIARVKDEPSQEYGEEKAGVHDKNPIRGSTLLFDQSLTTSTAHLEPSPQQSYVPFYGWWFSLRPRYNFTDKLRLQGRLDYYKELTNSQETTLYREDVFGDIWTDLVYSTPLAVAGRWKNTKVTLGARALWPTSKQSQAQGLYVALGATAGVTQKIPIRGDGATALNSARVGLSFTYLHPFTPATTSTNYGGFAYVRENVEGFSFVSDQLTGQPLVNHTLYAIADTGLQVTPKLGLTLDMIWINQWHYLPTDSVIISLPTGTFTIPRSSSDQQFTQLLWFVAAAEYELLPEVSLGVGYYNLTNAISPDGTVRGPFAGGQDNVFWSPDARIFFDVTANLDRIFEDASGRYRTRAPATDQAAGAAREARGSVPRGVR
jgi:hypothetical protein